MNTTLYLCRHGEVYNPQKIWYGRLAGFPLSESGRTQAAQLGAYLAAKPIVAVCASPLTRAHETARIIASHLPHMSVATDARLMDVHSPTQGWGEQQMDAIRWNFYRPQFLAAGGETFVDIWRRMKAALKQIVSTHRGGEVVVVSHGDPIAIVRLRAQHRRLSFGHIWEDYITTGQGYEIIFDEKGSMINIKKLPL